LPVVFKFKLTDKDRQQIEKAEAKVEADDGPAQEQPNL
jgi:hypothetical protein